MTKKRKAIPSRTAESIRSDEGGLSLLILSALNRKTYDYEIDQAIPF